MSSRKHACRSMCFTPEAGRVPFNAPPTEWDGERSTSLTITMSLGEAIKMARELLQAVERAEKSGDAVQVTSKGRGSWIVYGADPEDEGTPLLDPVKVPS